MMTESDNSCLTPAQLVERMHVLLAEALRCQKDQRPSAVRRKVAYADVLLCELAAALAVAPSAPDAALAVRPPVAAKDTRCTVCREDFPATGQQTRPVFEIIGPGFRICRRCRGAGKDAKRAASVPASPPTLEQNEREMLHAIIADCNALIDPEQHPDLNARIDAVLTLCDEAGKCVPASPPTREGMTTHYTGTNDASALHPGGGCHPPAPAGSPAPQEGE
jgi:hypothetical protein